MGWLSDLLRGGADELGWDDLIRRVAEAIAGRRQYGARGEIVFPMEVSVRITVGRGSVEVVQGFVDRPELDREVGAALANQFDVALDQLPTREYVVSAADRTTITVADGAPRAWQLVIDGGDLHGRVLTLPAGWSELAFGRGEWHGTDRAVRNDLVVCERTEFVSRRAGRLFRAGHLLEVAAVDQGDQLAVRRASGELVRPARTARGRVAMKSGDSLELTDGGSATIRLVVGRAAE